MKLIKKRNLHSEFPSFFDDFFTRDLFGLDKGNLWPVSAPAVNIMETDDSYNIEVACPGLKKDDFKVQIDRDVLTISFEKKDDKTTEGKYVKKEFSYASFKRSFTVSPETVDTDAIDATYEDGILKLTLPKVEEAKAVAKRTISIG